MGDPKKLRKKYATPRHPWNESTIEVERVIKKEYGLRKKKEIMIAQSFLKKYKNIAKRLIGIKTAQSAKETEQVLRKLQRLGLLPAGAILGEVLGLDVKNVLDRRLQSVLFRKGLARSIGQARQFIVHRHVAIGDKEITFPSYLTSLEEETILTFKGKSSLSDEKHPERSIPEKVKEEVKSAPVKDNNTPVVEKASETKTEEKPATTKTEDIKPSVEAVSEKKEEASS